MRNLYLFLLMSLCVCLGCQWNIPATDNQEQSGDIVIERFDRIEMQYLTTGDFAALQQMKTQYPAETRILIEEVLQLGMVDEPDINTRFLIFFQDSTLQVLMREVKAQYADMDDVSAQLTDAFAHLAEVLPGIEVPRVYTQIGSLDQSVVVDDSLVGISLDKYLGADNAIYQRYGYTEKQRSTMTREYIVPDCVGFYLLRHYPAQIEEGDTLEQRRAHMAKIQYVVNAVTGRKAFTSEGIEQVEKYLKSHHEVSIEQLLSAKNHQQQ